MNLPSTEFVHHQAAHCESGVTSNLLRNEGIPVSEAMSFGIGSGLFFVHIPFVKVMELPLTSYRSFPGTIFKKTCKRLQIPYEYHTYRDAYQGTRALDEFIVGGRAVGIRSNIYWLPYIPKPFRFQFNAHNLVVFGKSEDGQYQVSDPILEETSVCPSHAMIKARFAKGVLAPKGLIFFAKKPGTSVEEQMDKAIRAGIRETTNRMLFPFVPIAGIAGIKLLSRQVRKYPTKLKNRESQKLHIANIVRMQEEIGTGGAGFRYLYAAFLQEAGMRTNNSVLLEASKNMSSAGNLWREFATMAAKFCKDRLDVDYSAMPDKLMEIAAVEKDIFLDLRRRYLSR